MKNKKMKRKEMKRAIKSLRKTLGTVRGILSDSMDIADELLIENEKLELRNKELIAELGYDPID